MNVWKKNNLWLIILIVLVVIVLGLTTYFWRKGNIVYSNEVVTIMKKEDILDIVNRNKYSKTLEVALNSNNFIKDYTKDYEKIDYIEKDNFVLEVNKLLSLNLGLVLRLVLGLVLGLVNKSKTQ